MLCSQIEDFGGIWENVASAVEKNRKKGGGLATLRISVVAEGTLVFDNRTAEVPPQLLIESVKSVALALERLFERVFEHSPQKFQLRIPVVTEKEGSAPPLELEGSYTLTDFVGDIRVCFCEIDDKSKTLAYAFSPSDNPGVMGTIGGDVFIDSAETWTRELLEYVLFHELLHAFGMGHSDNPQSLMYPSASDMSRVPQNLSTEDAMAVYQRYAGETLTCVLNSTGRILLKKEGDSAWSQLPGRLEQVSCGANGVLAGVNRYHRIYFWENNRWKRVPGRLVKISVGYLTVGVNSSGRVYFQTPEGKWQRKSGRLVDISCGSTLLSGSPHVWGVNRFGNVYRYTTRWHRFPRVPGGAKQVVVGQDGLVAVLSRSSELYVWAGSVWQMVDSVPSSIEKIQIMPGNSLAVYINGTWYSACLSSRVSSPVLSDLKMMFFEAQNSKDLAVGLL